MRAPAVGSKLKAPEAPLVSAATTGPACDKTRERFPMQLARFWAERMKEPRALHELKSNKLVNASTSSAVVVSLEAWGTKVKIAEALGRREAKPRTGTLTTREVTTLRRLRVSVAI
jgi:hypothetical protein